MFHEVSNANLRGLMGFSGTPQGSQRFSRGSKRVSGAFWGTSVGYLELSRTFSGSHRMYLEIAGPFQWSSGGSRGS